MAKTPAKLKTAPAKAKAAAKVKPKASAKTKTGPVTVPTGASVEAFIKAIPDAQKREDSRALIAMMREATGEPAKMWGPSIIGFGSVHYKYESGREGDMGLTGFSPRKANLVVYILQGFSQYEDLLAKLGKHAHGKSCLYLKRLSDVDMRVLKTMIEESVAAARKKYG